MLWRKTSSQAVAENSGADGNSNALVDQGDYDVWRSHFADTQLGTLGQWSPLINWPLVAINTVLMKNGKVLMWDGGPDCIGSESCTVWDPVTGTFTPVPIPDPNDVTDIFCAGQTVLADGRVLIVGGHECVDLDFLGQANAYIFDPSTLQWTVMLHVMTYRRWYPTVTLLADGRGVVTSGSDVSVDEYIPIPEIFDPRTNAFTTLPAPT